ncbi:MAG TPA: hypothetical protein VGH51_02470 [Candidatus Angelobacter sp.]|jgi:hypothetical protein
MSWRSCLLLLLVLVCGALAQKSAAQWKEYAYPDAGFAVAAPVSPRIYPDPKATDVRVYRWELTSNAEFVIHSTGPRPTCLKAVTTFKESNGKICREPTFRDRSGTFLRSV